MDHTPSISVIIPTYNRASLIKRAAESVLNQTYKDLELIIIDDGSEDNTKEIVDSINDKRLVYVKQENQGCCAARNKGINIAKGKYIAFQDSDDVWHTDKLEKQIRVLQQNNADVIFAKVFIFGNLRKRKIPAFFKEGFLNKNQTTMGISAQTLFGKRDVFCNNKFDTSLRGQEDFELMMRLLEKDYSIYCMDNALVDCYGQEDSITSNHEKQIERLRKILQKNDKILKKLSKPSLEYLAKYIIANAFEIKDKKNRKKAVKFAYEICNSGNVKLEYFLHKYYFYSIRKLIYNSISIPTKHIIKFVMVK